jgi:L-rhamnose mutarotase
MDYEQKFKNLKKYAKMAFEEDVKLFDQTVYELADTKDPEVLNRLIDVFDDECEFPEVMYSLVHAIESYPKEVYITSVLNHIEIGVKNYPLWLDKLVNRIFNHIEYLIFFKKNMYLAPKHSLEKLFDIMEKESPHHILLIKELRFL